MNITVTSKTELAGKARAAKRRAPLGLRSGLERIASTGETLALSLAPHGPTGNYAKSIGSTVSVAGNGGGVEIGAKSPHAHLVEKGRTPGKIPPPAKIAKLFGLTDRHEAFMLARAIGRKGTQGADVFGLVERRLSRLVEQVASETARKIGKL